MYGLNIHKAAPDSYATATVLIGLALGAGFVLSRLVLWLLAQAEACGYRFF